MSAVWREPSISECLHCSLLCKSIGKFAYIESASHPTDYLASIEMPRLMIGEDYCLEFYYHMHGSGIGALRVTVDIDMPLPLFIVEGGRWRHTMIMIMIIILWFTAVKSILGHE